MHIQTIEMKDCAFSSETGRFHATLLMNADTRRLSLRAAADYRAGMARGEVAQVLLKDALRQLSRMPEHRNTTQQVTVAEDAFSCKPTAALAA